MMRSYLIIISLLFAIGSAGAQHRLDQVRECMLNYHQALVSKRYEGIDLYTHKDLRYAHSNGWVESKSEQIEHIKTGYLDYHHFQEDSIQVIASRKKAALHFNAIIDVTLNGNRHTYKLRVKEDWKKMNNHWYLLARQATKME